MPIGKHLLGKIFISHTSADKPFVRRLVRRLQRAHFKTWLDERELIPGDRLAERITEAVADAKCVLVVVSKTSVRSKWLSYELNLAAERMVKGKCRVIPVVISNGPLPAAVQGLLYADFRQSFDLGMKGVLTALEYEAKESARSAGFWSIADELVDSVFDGRGFVLTANEFGDGSYDIVTLDVASRGYSSTSVVYDKILSYRKPATPIGEQWWDEYVHARRDYGEELYLVVTERPVGIAAERTGFEERVAYRTLEKDIVGYETGHVVFADLSRLRSDRTRTAVLRDAHVKLTALAKDLV